MFHTRRIALFLLMLCCAGWAPAQQASHAPDETAQETTAPAKISDFAGKWHWLYHDKPFATMEIKVEDGKVTGSLTNSTFDVDENGKLNNALAHPGTSAIVRGELQGSALHIWTKDAGDETEWSIRPVAADKIEIKPLGAAAPSLKEGILADRITEKSGAGFR